MGRSRLPYLLAAGLVAGCSFDPAGVTGDPAPDAPSVDNRGADAAPADAVHDAAAAADAAAGEPPVGYQVVPGRDERWRPVLVPVTLEVAAADCADDADGAALALPDDMAGNVALRLFANAQVAGWRIWLGLTDADKEGDWRTLDGAPVDFTGWADGEPNDYDDDEDCAVMLGLDDVPEDRGRWNDVDCDELRPYVCAWPAPASS